MITLVLSLVTAVRAAEPAPKLAEWINAADSVHALTPAERYLMSVFAQNCQLPPTKADASPMCHIGKVTPTSAELDLNGTKSNIPLLAPYPIFTAAGLMHCGVENVECDVVIAFAQFDTALVAVVTLTAFQKGTSSALTSAIWFSPEGTNQLYRRR